MLQYMIKISILKLKMILEVKIFLNPKIKIQKIIIF
jgi:hypothetical protein